MFQFDEEKIKQLERKANDIRISIVEMLTEAGSGHPGGALGMADIFAALYFGILKHDPTNPEWDERDRLILSNGHICPVYYATLAHSGYIKMEELKTLRKFGSRLQGHPDRRMLPILETSSGPLGSGLAQAAGMALAELMNSNFNVDKYFFCIMSDGELDEGNSWEAIMFAGKERLKNLIAIIDRNRIQLSGDTENIMPLEPLKEKWEAFGWHVQKINGHNFTEIKNAIEKAKIADRPSVIIAETIPGKGISFMESDYKWHGRPITKEEAVLALKDLKIEN